MKYIVTYIKDGELEVKYARNPDELEYLMGHLVTLIKCGRVAKAVIEVVR